MDPKTSKVINHLKKIAIPLIVIVASASTTWAFLNADVRVNAVDIIKTKQELEVVKTTQQLVLQRLTGIETKLEYIIKEIDSLRKN